MTQECKHTNKELRYKPHKRLGQPSKMFAYQCLDCGKKISKDWEKFPNNPNEYAEWDFELENKYHFIRSEQYQNERQNEQRRKHQEYDQYINTDPRWQEIRKRVLRRENGICEACLISQSTQVHHDNYESLFNEVCYQLRAVCRNCHQKIHNIKFGEK